MRAAEALCGACHVPPWLFKIMFWLGYCNSMMNPIIYSCASRDFKRAFLRILRCRQCCRGVRPGSSAAESVDHTPRHRPYDALSATVGSGTAHLQHSLLRRRSNFARPLVCRSYFLLSSFQRSFGDQLSNNVPHRSAGIMYLQIKLCEPWLSALR